MAEVTKVVARFEADTSNLQAGAKRVQSTMGGIQQDVTKASKGFTVLRNAMGTALGVGAVAAIGMAGRAMVNFSREAVAMAEESQLTVRRLENIADQMGVLDTALGGTTDRLTDYAQALQDQTGVSDETIKDAQALILTFSEVAETAGETGGMFDRTTTAALDLAAAGFGEVEQNAKSLARALQDPTKGLMMLGRQGVTFTEQEQDKIKALVESNQLLEAQEIIMSAVEKQVGGTAAATATSMDKMKASIADVQENIGFGLLPVMEAIAGAFQEHVTPALLEFSNNVKENTGPALAQGFTDALPTILNLAESFLEIAAALRTAMEPALSAVMALLEATVPVVQALADVIAAVPGPIMAVVGALLLLQTRMAQALVTGTAKAQAGFKTAFIKMRTQATTFSATLKVEMIKARTQMGALATGARVMALQVAGAFRTIGAAAKGLIASIGPVGWALIGLTVAYEVFTSRSLAAEQATQAYKDSLDQLTGASTQASTALTATNLMAQEMGGFMGMGTTSVQDLSNATGISMAEMVAAVQGTDEEFHQFFLTLEEMAAAGKISQNEHRMLQEVLDGERAAVVGAREAIDIANQSTQIAAEMAQKAADATNNYRDAGIRNSDTQARIKAAQDATTDAFNSGTRAVEAMESAFQSMSDAMSDEASVDAAFRSINRLNDQLKSGSGELKGYTDEALDNREAIRQSAQAWIDYAQAAQDPEEQQKRLAQGQKEVREALQAADLDPKDSNIFQMFKEQRLQSKETVDEFAEQRDKAATYGTDVGKNFINGIIAQLEARKREVAAAAADVTNSMNTGGNAGIDARSPSRTAMEVAGNFVDGAVIGLRKGAPKVDREARRLGNVINRAFADAMAPRGGGPASDAFSTVFGSRDDIRNSARALQDASWALADARDAVAEAEQLLAEARKEGNAREIAAAERELARARRDAADAADAAKTAEFVAENQKALLALERISQKYDYIVNALEQVQGAFDALGDLTATPFGLESNLFRMFSTNTMDPRTIASSFQQVTGLVRDGFAVLNDPKIVGRKQARRNRREMRQNLAQIETLAAEAIQLRQRYEANLQKIADLEKAYQSEVAGINSRYDALEKAGKDNLARLEESLKTTTGAYEEQNRVLQSLISERDSFISRMSDGFRSFVNDFARDAASGARVVERSTKQLANGITVTMEREIAGGGASGLRGALESRLEEIRTFSSNIRTLMERGLDPALVRDFVSAGVQSAGDTVAALTNASDEDLQAINSVQTALAQEAADFGDYVADAWFNAGIEAQAAIVSPLEQAVTDAQAAVDAARSYLDQIAAERETALASAASTFETEKARLESENDALLVRMDEVATEIEGIVAELTARLPVQTMQAGQAAIDKMLEGFRSRFPAVSRAMNKLLDRLAKSLNRTATVTVRAVNEAGQSFATTGRSVGTAKATSATLATPVPTGSFTAANAPVSGGTTVINLSVNAGVGDPREIGRVAVEAIEAYERSSGRVFARA